MKKIMMFFALGLFVFSSIGLISALTTSIISPGDNWKYFKGYSTPDSWNSLGFNDSLWSEGPTGIGYADGDDLTVLDDMIDNYLTVYTRKAFNIPGFMTVTNVTLNVDYDDGFVAYLNGVEVVRENMPAGSINKDTTASGDHDASIDIVYGTGIATFDLTGFSHLLVDGENVLAVEVHNKALSSSDLSFIPELEVTMDDTPPIVSEFSFYMGMLTMISALGVFFFVRRD